MYMGVEGYDHALHRIHQAFNRATKFVRATPGISFPAPPDLCIIAVTAATEEEETQKEDNYARGKIMSSSLVGPRPSPPPLDIFALATVMTKRGWNPFTSAFPNCMALCLGAQHGDTESGDISPLLQAWMDDVRDGVRYLQGGAIVPLEGNAAVYGAAGSLPDPLLEKLLRRYTDITLTVKAKHRE